MQELITSPWAGEGEHAYFFLEKTNLNTQDVVRLLAEAYHLPEVAIGYAGRKDKFAVTQQWFSVHTPRDEWLINHPDIELKEQSRHEKKLRIGSHTANRFSIVLNNIEADPTEVFLGLEQAVPNGFGVQRFGDDNLAVALHWLFNLRRTKKGKRNRGWHLSTLRSFLFNEVLAARVAANNYTTQLSGDVLEEGVPTAPLWGRGKSETTDMALEIEQQTLKPHADMCDELEFAGVTQARRKMAMIAKDVTVMPEQANSVRLNFELPVGSYATVFLSNFVALNNRADVA